MRAKKAGFGDSCELPKPVLSLILATTYFPGALRPSIVGPGGLNCRVRNGNGWTPTGIVTRKRLSIFVVSGLCLVDIGLRNLSIDECILMRMLHVGLK